MTKPREQDLLPQGDELRDHEVRRPVKLFQQYFCRMRPATEGRPLELWVLAEPGKHSAWQRTGVDPAELGNAHRDYEPDAHFAEVKQAVELQLKSGFCEVVPQWNSQEYRKLAHAHERYHCLWHRRLDPGEGRGWLPTPFAEKPDRVVWNGQLGTPVDEDTNHRSSPPVTPGAQLQPALSLRPR